MFNDFLYFKRMLFPWFIQIAFWVGVAACILAGFSSLYHEHAVLKAIRLIILMPILLRVGCEFLILFFRMNETLTDIKEQLTKRGV